MWYATRDEVHFDLTGTERFIVWNDNDDGDSLYLFSQAYAQEIAAHFNSLNDPRGKALT